MTRRRNIAQPPAEIMWHAVPVYDLLESTRSSASGLQEDEARARLAMHGLNQLAPSKRRGPLRRLLGQFHNILLYVMMAASAITAILGQWVDTGVLLAAVVLNAVIGFIQEGKAESALDAIHTMLAPRATVIRNGRRYEIDASLLTRGDLVVINPGDRIPADLRLIAAKDFHVEEAALTGESLPVEKGIEAVAADAPLGDRYCMAFMGTVALTGQAHGIVVATGANTEIGRIDQLLAGIQSVTTPLMRQINRFSYWLALVILAIGVLVFVFGTLARGESVVAMFMMVVALVASAIPEGLPAIMTVTLALGVQRMARQNAIVRRLPAVETLGSVTVICTDKTGTLTRNEMTVQRVVCAGCEFNVSGVGYGSAGNFSSGTDPADAATHPVLAPAIRAGVLCNDASLRQDGEHWLPAGDPTEVALLTLGHKAGLVPESENAVMPRLDSIPFESANRYMATLHRDAQGDSWIVAKGAPEQIIELCEWQLTDAGKAPIQVDYWRRMATDIAARGLRVLALASKGAGSSQLFLNANDDIQEGFTLLALVGIVDLPREEAVKSVHACHQAGIRVKMITGDHVDTARAIGAQLNIGVGKPAMTGAEIALMDDAALRRVVHDIDIFARASPEHKLRLVQALQADGQVVAMTGDGVNDAPALKRADVGISMGLKGTEAARQASDMVLADDNFATIAIAVREGRAVYDNIRKFILFMLPTNGGEALIVIAALFAGIALPLTPAQVLWINMATAGSLGLALAFEPPEHGIMRRRPRPPQAPLLSAFFIWRIVFVSLLMMTGGLGLFLWELSVGATMAQARTMAVNAVVVSEMFYLLCSRRITRSVLTREGLTGNPYVLWAIAACAVLQLLYTHAPFMQAIFGSSDLTLVGWLKVLAVGVLVFICSELEKLLLRFFRERRGAIVHTGNQT